MFKNISFLFLIVASAYANASIVPSYCALYSMYTNERSEIKLISDQPVELVAGPYTAEFQPHLNNNGVSVQRLVLSKITPVPLEVERDEVFDPTSDRYVIPPLGVVCKSDPDLLKGPEGLPELARYYLPSTSTDDSRREVVVDAPVAYVSIHSSQGFDHNGDSRQPTRDVQKIVHDLVPDSETVMVSHIQDPDADYYLARNEVDKYIFSESGAHKLKFSRAHTLVMAGGYVDACFCEGLRDVLTGVQDFSRPLTILIPLESLFYHNLDIEYPAEILHHVVSTTFGISDRGYVPSGFFCQMQNSQRPLYTSKRSDDYTVDVSIHTGTGPYAQPTWVGRGGNGPKHVEIKYVSVANLPLYLTGTGH